METLSQHGGNQDKRKRKRKGDAEKLRDKKMKALEADTAKCKKLTFLFPSIDAVRACMIKDNNSNNNIVITILWHFTRLGNILKKYSGKYSEEIFWEIF